jgi:hypothetical protein
MSLFAEFGTLRQLCRLLLAVSVITIAGVNPVLGQVGTPEPVACDEPARPVSFIADLNASLRDETTPTPITDVPDGTEVTDQELRAEVTAVIEELTACVNSGEILRAFSLLDDQYVRKLIDPDAVMEPEVALDLGATLATPQPATADEMFVLEEILSIRQTADGAVVVIFRIRVGLEESEVDLYALRKVDLRWLIVDGVTDVEFDPGDPAST